MKLPECKFSDYILVVTGMAYIIESSGTSKVVAAHEAIFRAKGIGYVAVFPISRSRGEGADWHCTTTGCYGLVIDGQFVGVMTANKILNTLLDLQHAGKNCIGILVHHIIRNDISEIEWMLEKIKNVPVVYYLHDFYTCCVNPNLMKNDEQSCIDRNVSCEGCCYARKKQEHIQKVRKFLKSFENRMTFVAPSEYTKSRWVQFYPEYEDRTVVILHQKSVGEYTGNKEGIREEEPLRLGFVGARKQIKGWHLFKKVVAEAQKAGCRYDFYYFGNETENIPGVENVYVDIATQGKDAMIEHLREKRIAAVFLVGIVGETYSYTTYESNAANCYIFAMSTGGNIPYVVKKNGWGRVFSSEEELLREILDEEGLREKINDWKLHARPGAGTYTDNDEVAGLFAKTGKAKLHWTKRRDSATKEIKALLLDGIFRKTRLKNRG